MTIESLAFFFFIDYVLLSKLCRYIHNLDKFRITNLANRLTVHKEFNLKKKVFLLIFNWLLENRSADDKISRPFFLLFPQVFLHHEKLVSRSCTKPEGPCSNIKNHFIKKLIDIFFFSISSNLFFETDERSRCFKKNVLSGIIS